MEQARPALILALLVVLAASGLSSLRLWANLAARRGDVIQAAHVAPFDRTMVFAASFIQLKRGECYDAIRNLQTLVRLYRHYWDAKNNLAICLAVVGRLNDAKKEWEEILREWPYHEAAGKNLAELAKGGIRTKR